MAKSKRLKSSNKKAKKATRPIRKWTKPDAKQAETTVVLETNPMSRLPRIVSYDNDTGEVVHDEDVSFEELIELCRAGALPDDVVAAAEEKIYGKRGVPANDDASPHDVEDYNKKYIWDRELKNYRRRTAWDPPYCPAQGAFFDPVSIATVELLDDDLPWDENGPSWERELVDKEGGTLSRAMMTPEEAARFVMPKNDTGLPPPVVDLLGRPLFNKPVKGDAVIFAGKPAENVQEHRPPEGTKIAVRVMSEEVIQYPDLILRIYIEADNEQEEAMFARLFAQACCKKAETPLEADVVLFGGGSDVDPALYGASRHNTTFFDPLRDSMDIDLYHLCLEHGIPMVGVCRGAQFLHVMQDGKLYQDIDNHYGPHSMWDVDKQVKLDKISSSHHQSVIRQDSMKLVGTCFVSRTRYRDNLVKEMGQGANRQMDIEAFFYRDACIFGVQGHPEYGGFPEYSKWFLDKLNDYIVLNPDVDWVDTGNDIYRRIKPDLLEEAKALRSPIVKPHREILKITGPKGK